VCLHRIFVAYGVLVTGGAGFSGLHFVKRLLQSGDDVVVLDKLTYSGNRGNLPAEVEFHEGDMAEAADVARAARGCEAIVNFAAETHVDRSILTADHFGRTEFRGTQTLLEQIRETGARLVQVSTDEVYGDLEAGGSSTEGDPLRPSSPYSAAKAAGDLLIPAYVRTFDVDASITRGSNTYGPNQYPEKLIPLFVTNALDGDALPLYGDGRQVRDWLFVEDHCAGIELVLRNGASGEIYNGSLEAHASGRHIAERILALTGADRSLLRRVADREGHDRRYSLDTTKLRKLGWSPQTSFEDGLHATVEWYRERRDWWQPIKSGEYREYYARQYAERLANATAV
jgi:dTDP-glucose 4,6-dehydratase